MNLNDILDVIGGEILNYDESISINGVQPLEKAKSHDICFIFSRVPTVIKSKTRCIVSKNEIKSFKYTQIIHPQPRLAMATLLAHMFPNGLNELTHFINKNVDIANQTSISKPVQIGAFVSIGFGTEIKSNTKVLSNVSIGKNCKIGKNCIIYSNVSIYDNTVIGDNVIIHANTTIGSDGFGYEKSEADWKKIPHISSVIIEDNVEIGSNTSIDKGCLSPTHISDGVKIDNHSHIAHNCVIGKNTIIVAGTAIGGSVQIGENCILAGSVSVIDNVSIGNNVIIFAKSGVTKSIRDNEKVSGFPAINHKDEIRKQAFLNRLYKSNN